MRMPIAGRGLWARSKVAASARGSLWILLPTLLSTSPVRADLGMDDAARLALDGQPQLLAQQASIDALRENAVAAGELPDPKLRFGIASLPVDSFSFPQEPMTQAVLGVSQAIPGGDKRRLSTSRLEREAGQGETSLAAQRLRITRDTRLAWLDAWWPQAAIGLIDNIEQEVRRQVEWSEIAFKTGKLSQEETLAMRGQLELTRDRKADWQRRQARMQAVLARWVGTDKANEILAPLPQKITPPEKATLAAKLDRHPDLTALASAVDVARSDADLAREAYKSDWNVDVSYGVRGGNRADFISVQVGVDLPLFTANRQDRRLAARLAGINRAEQMVADRRRALESELAIAYVDWHSATERLAHYESDIIPLAKRRAESAMLAYGTDRASYGRVLETRRAVLEARLQALEQRAAQARAAILIQYFDQP